MFCPNRYLKTLKFQFQNPTFYLSNPQIHSPALQFVPNEADKFQFSKPQLDSRVKPRTLNIQISHPWPEWADLMKKLLRNGYFDEIGNPFLNDGVLGNKEANCIRTACLNFARDQYQLIRCLSRKDILAIVEFGCPSTDRKVVNSGKRIRAHVGIDEGNVCSSCILRGDCDRAYIKAREDEGGRTVDVMRHLVVFGLDPIVGSVENKPCLNKRVKESVRMLLKEMVDNSVDGQDVEPPKDTTSKWIVSTETDEVAPERNQTNVPMKQGDWICPKCDFLNFSRNVKCLRCDTFCEERLKKVEEQVQDHLPLKKGDWICEKCNFLNFARNTRCLQCREKPTKRQINPGEWECESCNYINFRRNMVCLKCDHRRPIASKTQYIAPQPPNYNLKNHPVLPSFAREEQNRYECYNDSLKYVKDESGKCSGSSSWDGAPGFVDFPIHGGKSDLSSNIQMQEVWKTEMEKKSRTKARDTARDDSGSPGRIEFLASVDDDDDEMAEWFEGRKKA